MGLEMGNWVIDKRGEDTLLEHYLASCHLLVNFGNRWLFLLEFCFPLTWGLNICARLCLWRNLLRAVITQFFPFFLLR